MVRRRNNGGTGMAHLPFRLNCRPELPLITLRRP